MKYAPIVVPVLGFVALLQQSWVLAKTLVWGS